MKKLIVTLSFITTSLVVFAQNVGDPAPDFTVNTLSDADFTLSSKKGKVVFLYLFGATCSICRGSGNQTETLYKEFLFEDDFTAIGVDVWDDPNSSVNEFINITGITYTVGLNAGTPVGQSFNSSHDVVFVIDKNGIIQYKGSPISQGVMDNARSAINNALDAGGTTNIKSFENNVRLDVYPNPFTNQFILENTTGNALKKITVYAIHGKMVYAQTDVSENTKTTIAINTVDWENGIYVAELLFDNNSKEYVKLIKQ